jgi:hypothetical protein
MLDQLINRVLDFEAAAHKLLQTHEGAKFRIIDASKSLARVSALSVKQEDMLKQSVRCI